MTFVSDINTSTPAPGVASGAATGSSRPAAASRPVRRSAGLVVALIATALFAVSCSTGPGSEEDFIEVLTRNGSLTETEASCITSAVFDEYETDQDSLSKISAAPDFEFLSSEEGVDGFTEFFEQQVLRCAGFGPTPG